MASVDGGGWGAHLRENARRAVGQVRGALAVGAAPTMWRQRVVMAQIDGRCTQEYGVQLNAPG